MLHADALHVTPKVFICESCKENGNRKKEFHVVWQSGLLFFVELIDFINDLETVLARHLEIKQ